MNRHSIKTGGIGMGSMGLFSGILLWSSFSLLPAQETFVANVDVDEFILAEGSVFWSSDCGVPGGRSGDIQRKPASGGPVATVHNGGNCSAQERIWSRSGAADEDHVFWIDATGRVLKKKWSGGAVQSVALMEKLNLNALARPLMVAGDQRVYWVEHVLSDNNEQISKSRVFWAAKDGSSGRKLVFDLVPTYVRQIQAVGDTLFILTSDSTLRRWSSGPSLATVASGNVRGFAVGAGQVCWSKVDFSNQMAEIWSGPLSGVTAAQKHVSMAHSYDIEALAIDDKHVYWAENRGIGGGPILRVPTAGGTAEVLVPNVPRQSNLADNGTYLFWKASNREIARIKTSAAASSVDLEALTLEAIQAIQNSNNDVSLVAGKDTFVRLYSRIVPTSGHREVKLHQPAAILRAYPVESGVRGPELEYDGRTGLPNMGGDFPAVVKRAQADREKREDSLWFWLPDAWTAGDVELEVEINPNRVLPETNYNNNRASLNVTFHKTEPLTLVFVPVKDSTKWAVKLWESAPKDFDRMLERNLSVAPTHDYDNRFCPSALGPYDFSSGKDRNDLLTRLNKWRSDHLATNPKVTRNIRYCAVIPAIPGLGGGANWGQACWWKFDLSASTYNKPWCGMTMAEELGHSFGQDHVDCGSPAWPDAEYPYTGQGPGQECWISGPKKTGGSGDGVGWDSITQTLIPFKDARDYMSYGGPVWVSDYRWKRIFDKLKINGGAGGRSPLPRDEHGPALSLRGVVDRFEPGGARFVTSRQVTGSLKEQIDQELEGEGLRNLCELRSYNAEGAQVGLAHPLVKRVNDSPAEGFFVGLVEFDPDITQIELVLSEDPDTILARLEGGHRPPMIEIQSPVRGRHYGETLPIVWQSDDLDGHPLDHLVRFSSDGGSTWQIIADQSAGSEVLLDATSLPGGEDCRVEVTASDGILSTTAVSETFSLPLRAPRPRIKFSGVATAGGFTGESAAYFPVGSRISLRGTAFDPEDGAIEAEELRWILEGRISQEATGSRYELFDLPPGEYGLTLLATDRDGLQGTSHRPFIVDPKFVAAAPEAPRLDGYVDDAAYLLDERPLRLSYDTGEQASVMMVWADDALYAGFSGLPVGSETPPDWIAVCLDADNSDDAFAQPDDSRFILYADGRVIVERGTGTSWEPLIDSSGLQGRVSRAGGRWFAEMRIDGKWFGGRQGQLVGLRVGQYHRRFSGDDSNWPRESGWRTPASWGDVRMGDDSTPIDRYREWAQQFIDPFGPRGDIGDDFNGDGKNNFYSYVFNTNPSDSAGPNFPVAGSDSSGGLFMRFTLLDDPSLYWIVEVSDDAKNWTGAIEGSDYTIANVTPGGNEVIHNLKLIKNREMRFYRIRFKAE